MKIIYYLLAAFFGLIGVLSLLRTMEILLTGGGLKPVQLLIGLIGLAVAAVCLKKARAV